ncbi:MAG: ribosome silencing factor [Phycisphaerae bacterium]|nr:ribosome silencing factor [Phycisphaerae bacterium]
MTRTHSTVDPEQVLGFSIEVARLVSDMKCEQVVVLDVRGKSQVCDYIIIGSGTSDRQMKSVAKAIEKFGAEQGSPHFRSNSDSGNTWIVVDFIEVVVHLFEPGQRAYYDLENLWSDGVEVSWDRTEEARSG